MRLAAAILLAVVCLSSAPGAAPSFRQEGAAPNEFCPVMPEEPTDPDYTLEYEGRMIGLCCRKCRRVFREDPERYLAVLASWKRGEDGPRGERPGVAMPEDDEAEGPGPPGPIGADAGPGTEPGGSGETEPAVEVVQPTSRAARPGAFVRRIGRFHPLAVHLPIGLLLAAGLAEFLYARRGHESYRASARFCLAFGAVGALTAALLGWALAYNAGFPQASQQDLFLHRWIGTLTATLATWVWFLSARAERGDRERKRYRILLALLVLGVALSGHFGGSLVYGPDYLFG